LKEPVIKKNAVFFERNASPPSGPLRRYVLEIGKEGRKCSAKTPIKVLFIKLKKKKRFVYLHKNPDSL